MNPDAIIDVTPEGLLQQAALKRQSGYRFVTLTCLDAGDGHEILYHFDRGYHLAHLRVRLPKGDELPSISAIFFAATLAENEMKDFFGVAVRGLAIDYQGKLLLTEDAPRTPLNKDCGMKVDVRRPAPAPEAKP